MARSVNTPWGEQSATSKAKLPSGPKPSKAESATVTVQVEWTGTVEQARALGHTLRALISDLDEQPERKGVLELRRAWREGTLKAGVEHA